MNHIDTIDNIIVLIGKTRWNHLYNPMVVRIYKLDQHNLLYGENVLEKKVSMCYFWGWLKMTGSQILNEQTTIISDNWNKSRISTFSG